LHFAAVVLIYVSVVTGGDKYIIGVLYATSDCHVTSVLTSLELVFDPPQGQDMFSSSLHVRVRNRTSVSDATCLCSRNCFVELTLAKRRISVKAVVDVRPYQHLLLFLRGRKLKRSRTDVIIANKK
jgi:hypothetical protein